MILPYAQTTPYSPLSLILHPAWPCRTTLFALRRFSSQVDPAQGKSTSEGRSVEPPGKSRRSQKEFGWATYSLLNRFGPDDEEKEWLTQETNQNIHLDRIVEKGIPF